MFSATILTIIRVINVKEPNMRTNQLNFIYYIVFVLRSVSDVNIAQFISLLHVCAKKSPHQRKGASRLE